MNNFDDIYNFQPNSEEERQFFEVHSSLSITTSRVIRSLPQEHRLLALKEAAPSDTSLMALYFWSMKQEDYETSAVAKELLLERGLKIPS